MNQRGRGARGLPELVAGVGSVCGGARANTGSLVARRVCSVGGNDREGERFL